MLTVTDTHKHTHIHELVFSLCPYVVSGVVLLLCCSQTGPFHRCLGVKTEAVTSPTGLPPINYAPLIYTLTNTQWPPQSQKLLLLGFSYWPLWDFRASLFNKVL